MKLSLEARLMARPTLTYAALRGETGVWPALRRPVRLAFVLACFISFTTTGRLSARMVVDGFACWSFVPLLNLAVAGALARRFSRRDLQTSIDGYLAAWGPWLAWLAGIAGVAVWFPPGTSEVWPLMPSLFIFLSLGLAWSWSSWIQYRCLTVLWGLRPRDALGLLGAMKLVVWGGIVLFFFASDQLEPRLGSLLGG